MRGVQVRISRTAFAESLGDMRSWLDRNNRPLVRFETATEGTVIIINVQFEDDTLGEAFEREFRAADQS